MIYSKAGWRKWIFKAPIQLWRLGLCPKLGRYLLILTHKSSKSGRKYHAMVEFHRLNGNSYIRCAYGPQSDWYQSIKAHPLVSIQTSKGSESMLATRVTDDQGILELFSLFQRRDPPLTNLYLRTLDIEPIPDDVLEHKD